VTRDGLLVGSQIHPADGDAHRRQIHAMTRLREVCRWPLLNLQFHDRANLQELDGFETLPVLLDDSPGVTGRAGRRKPIVSEMFTRLAEAAVQRGLRYFVFTNSDIVFTAAAIDRILAGDRRSFVFSRTDVDAATGCDLQPLIYGADVFAVEAEWWMAHRASFRPYVIGENAWDNVYAAQLLCWSGGMLLNREPLVRHEAHPIVWSSSPFAGHNAYLAGLDRMYFTRWVRYVRRLESLRAEAGGFASIEAELRLQDEAFLDWKPGVADRALQALRVVKLELRRRLPRAWS
jgi:hypothetical protein